MMPSELRLFDTFMFSEPHEAELLLAKLHIESNLVEKWIVVENAYTHKGALKGNHLEGVVGSDPRFAEFRDRIVVVSLERDFAAEYRHTSRDRIKLLGKHAAPGYDRAAARSLYRELPFWHAEAMQRNAAFDAILEASGGRGWVVVTDTDEMLDASTPSRRDAFRRSIGSGAPLIALGRRRFNFDFDNYCPAGRHVSGVSIPYLADRQLRLADIRRRVAGIAAGPDACVFEYSFCFPRPQIERKLATYMHRHPESSLDDALTCNHMMFLTRPTTIFPDMWYEKVPLEQTGAPSYILENFESLKTGVVNPDYAAARARRYPELFGPPG